ncbi:hypothetical protein GGD81_000197 [Rhodobium orientis]|uniref:Lipoprotein n=2 Tax=Rhodobium orientis TaxID=34017 RepID=A0A327K3U2_9HYPH|nr:hypothetical protein [Rhodobium orientis]MBB4301182.1 hypothetical protein [Rhodobium orientis]RAI30048.1 hypothetical protein CH339_00505 [Rhodobium orientis]
MTTRLFLLIALAATSLLAGCGPNGSPPTPGALGATPPPAAAPPPVPASDATIAFEPFIGMPGNRADELAKRIGVEAQRQNLNLVRRLDAEATYRVRGYLTAVGSDSGATIVYVYDIFSGNTRVHRITGQEVSEGSDGDPWNGVENDALKNIAARTVIEIKSWLQGGARQA